MGSLARYAPKHLNKTPWYTLNFAKIFCIYNPVLLITVTAASALSSTCVFAAFYRQ